MTPPGPGKPPSDTVLPTSALSRAGLGVLVAAGAAMVALAAVAGPGGFLAAAPAASTVRMGPTEPPPEPSPTRTVTETATVTATPTVTETVTETAEPTATPTVTGTTTATATATVTSTATATATSTVTATSSPSPTAPPSPTPTAPPGKETPESAAVVSSRLGPGSYEVGLDVAAGTYRSAGAVEGSATCHYVLRDESGETLLERRRGGGQAVTVTLEDGQELETSGCEDYVRLG